MLRAGPRSPRIGYAAPSAHQGASRPRQAPSAPGSPRAPSWRRPSLFAPGSADPGVMRRFVMTRTLPAGADIAQLRTQAKELRRAVAGGNPGALSRLREVRPDIAPPDCTLRDA